MKMPLCWHLSFLIRYSDIGIKIEVTEAVAEEITGMNRYSTKNLKKIMDYTSGKNPGSLKNSIIMNRRIHPG